MKIEFESRGEIKELCELLQNIYPATLVVDVDDMIDVVADDPDRGSPWNWDGYHIGARMSVEDPEDDSMDCGTCSYVSGQLDALFHCIRMQKLTPCDVAEVTGRSTAEIKHLYNMWIRKVEG